MHPLVTYYGGKQKLASKLVPLIESIPHTVYTEPFAGGAAVLFARTEPARIEAINDHDERIVKLYRTAQLQPRKFRKHIAATLFSEAEYRKASAVLKSQTATDFQVAVAVYVQLHLGFASKLHGGVCRSTTKKKPQAYHNKTAALNTVLQRLQNVQVGCCDALKFIRHYDSPTTLHYVDPPYPNTDQGHYGGYTINDFQRLIDCLAECKGTAILSNYEQPLNMPAHWERHEFRAISSAGKARTPRTEVVWIARPA
jgi:DNA adenine methylase